MQANDFAARVRAALDDCRAAVVAFRTGSGSFSETVADFDRLTRTLNGLSGRVGMYVHVHPDEDMRNTCVALQQEISKLGTELSLDRGLFDRLANATVAADADPTEARLLEHALRDFRRAGVDRDEATRERVQELRAELVEIGQAFDRNIITGGKTYVVEDGHEGLRGLPEDFLASHPEREDGTVVLSTDPTDRMPVMTYAMSDELRREYFITAMSRAFPENRDVLDELLQKRHELATLLGYEHYADFVTETKMTGSAAVARAFLDRIVGTVKERAEAEVAELLELKGEGDVVMEWERGYLAEKLRRQRYAFDSQAVRPYFAYDRVRDGVLATSAELYDVEFRKNDEVETWHPSVSAYDVVDQGEIVARFYMDMHPRDNKFKHAAMFHVSEGVVGIDPEDTHLPEAALVCNFPEPTNSDPGLMLHDEVTTFFHEFGHLLHHLFGGRQRFQAFSGISTEYDFVEVPSQMFEEWAWDTGVLQRFARHYQTDEPIPDELVRKLRAADEYGKGLTTLVQMYYANLSLEVYSRDPGSFDPFDLALELKDELVPLGHEEGNHFVASFGHLHGYSAIYYTYMWSLVIAKDVFSRFTEDLMNGATANEYRAKILAPGGSKDAKELVRDFLGREYDFAAFETWLAS